MHSEHLEYARFSGKRRLQRAVRSLAGIIDGISIDRSINDMEVAYLETWLESHRHVATVHPFKELMAAVGAALADGVMTSEEKQDLDWLCRKLVATDFGDYAVSGIQHLHALVAGIAADTIISEAELEGLSDWLQQHEELRTLWPYDEIDSLVTEVLRDRKITDQEQRMLAAFFLEFTPLLDSRVVGNPGMITSSRITGICSVCPEIVFGERAFCFTGASAKHSRRELKEIVEGRGGRVTDAVSSKLDYLVIGAEGNPCWMYACYGRKVEAAVSLRKQGATLMIVHETDFYDALAS